MKKALLITFVSSFIAFVGYSQKQPQIQQVSVRAPGNVKIDGKINEWPAPYLNDNNKEGYLMAFNSTNRIHYLISNDDENLYMVIVGGGANATKKALAGGVTLTISHSIEKKSREKDAANVAVTFPLPLENDKVASIMGVINSLNNYVDDTVANRKQIDSIAPIANKRIADEIKEIKITGVPEFSDPVLSIYNTTGIKGAMRFIRRMPVIELAIPLKYLHLSANDEMKISYNIKFNAPIESNSQYPAPVVIMDAPMPTGSSMPAYGISPDYGYMQNATDFWAEYTLIKKQ